MKRKIDVVFAVVGFLAIGFIAGAIVDDIFWEDGLTLMAFFFFGSLGAWGAFALSSWFTQENVGRTLSQTSTKLRESKKWIESEISQESEFNFYAQAEEEVENGTFEKGLWAKSLIEADGDESKRKITYMKLRAEQLERRSQKAPSQKNRE